MVRNDQARPIAPVSAYYPRSDEVDKAISAEFDLRQNGCLRCCGCTTAVLLLAVTTLVVFFTVLRIRHPVVTAERFAFSQLQRGTSLSLLNLSVEITVAVRNPNAAAFRYENMTTSLYYRGEFVGKGGVPPGKVGAWARKQLNVTVAVDGGKVAGAEGFVGDWRSGNLSFRSETWMAGQVKMTEVIKKKLVVRLEYEHSDRDLRIEIVPDLPDFKNDADGFTSIADWARNRKRRREDIRKEASEATVEQILSFHMPDTDDAAPYENQDLEPMAMIEESPTGAGVNPSRLGDEAAEPSDSGALTGDAELAMDCSTVLRVKTLHISSLLLAAKSPFFYKLFSNGMRESDQRHVTLRIHASEEAAFIDLLNFMYSRTLSATTPTALLDVLMAADKFEVASCMRYCSKLLRNLPMTCESALLYLDIPSTILMEEAVQPLTDAAKQFLATHYKDISKFQEEVLNLPLAGIEAILSSDDLQVASEDTVYDFVLKWARIHYPKLEDRRAILGSRLGRLVRFPYMTCRKLKKVLSCNDFDPDLTSKVVLEALFFKAEAPYRQRSLAAEEGSGSDRRFVERAYKYRPVKVVEFEVPHQQCIVYLDLKRDECAHLFPYGRVYSQAFHLGGQGFFLSAHCNMDQQSSFHCFGLFLGMQEKGSVSFTVEYEFAVRSNPLEDYMSKYKGNYTFTGGEAVGNRNLFGIPWMAFMADESAYFINGVLHLRAELTIRH